MEEKWKRNLFQDFAEQKMQAIRFAVNTVLHRGAESWNLWIVFMKNVFTEEPARFTKRRTGWSRRIKAFAIFDWIPDWMERKVSPTHYL